MSGSVIRMGYLLLAGMVSILYIGQVQAEPENTGMIKTGATVRVELGDLERQLSVPEGTVYGGKQLQLSPTCPACTVKWTSSAKELTGADTTTLGSKPYLFASGIQGVALSVTPTEDGHLNVGLMNSQQVKEGPVAGTIALPGLSRQETDPTNDITVSYPVELGGHLIAPACEMDSGQDLDFSLSPVTKSALLSVSPGEPLQTVSASASLSLRCAMNVDLTMKFQGTHPEGFQGVLQAISDSNQSADSGVGFIVKATESGKAATWDNTTALSVHVIPQSGNVSVPFTAMYTRTGGDIIPGKVNAVGTISVTLP
ncbi:fimbrial protein [Salmonella enterica]|nr:fimbrial protein [Salmonella enterica]ECV0008074.1 fimbrial protein [Salmonella enterica subsp. enterica serovar Saintpaul]EEI9142287.1 fimbrial protein [Salmonella enterica subsp. enterica serovar Saintpaul]ELO1930290.1 fimbrial protein [Salmonella enterica]